MSLDTIAALFISDDVLLLLFTSIILSELLFSIGISVAVSVGVILTVFIISLWIQSLV